MLRAASSSGKPSEAAFGKAEGDCVKTPNFADGPGRRPLEGASGRQGGARACVLGSNPSPAKWG